MVAKMVSLILLMEGRGQESYFDSHFISWRMDFCVLLRLWRRDTGSWIAVLSRCTREHFKESASQVASSAPLGLLATKKLSTKEKSIFAQCSISEKKIYMNIAKIIYLCSLLLFSSTLRDINIYSIFLFRWGNWISKTILFRLLQLWDRT